jgi:hypothetical protein
MAGSPSMTPSSMAAGGTSDTSEAQTARGSEPEAAQDEPAMDAGDRESYRHLVRGRDAYGGLAWRNVKGGR